MPDRSPFPLPIAIEEIDRDWLTAALRTRASGVTVRNCEIVDMMRSTCTKVRLKLDMDEAGQRAGIPGTVILKGGFEPHSRAMAHMHESEVHGYRDVFPVHRLPSPDCYFADFDAERGQGIVIMEDLVARGVSFCNPLKPQSFEQVAARLTVLARWHAKTWGSPDFAPGKRWAWAEEVARRSRHYFTQFLEPKVWQSFVDSPRGAAASVRFHDRHWMDDVLNRHVVASARLPQCIIHGDTHLGNLYIDKDGTPGFFDSLPGRAPGMAEVAYHMGGALDTADRPRWERALVLHYLEELGRNGVTPPSFDEAMWQYAVFLARGYLIFLINDSIFQPEAYNTAYVARFSAAMIDHDTVGLIKAIA